VTEQYQIGFLDFKFLNAVLAIFLVLHSPSDVKLGRKLLRI